MKKILTVSLVAMMAVSTARADIASTAYVQGAVGAETALRTSAINTLSQTVGANKAAADKTQEDLDTLEGTTNVDVTGGMVGKIKELLFLADLGIESKIINAEVEDNIFKVLENKEVKGTIISRGN